jgi:hypothetical protein
MIKAFSVSSKDRYHILGGASLAWFLEMGGTPSAGKHLLVEIERAKGSKPKPKRNFRPRPGLTDPRASSRFGAVRHMVRYTGKGYAGNF